MKSPKLDRKHGNWNPSWVYAHGNTLATSTVEAASHDAAHGSRAGGGGHETGFVFATKPHVGWVPPQVRDRVFLCAVCACFPLACRAGLRDGCVTPTHTHTPTPTNLTGSPPPPHCLCTCCLRVRSGQRSQQCTFKSRCHACRCVTAPTPTPPCVSLPPRTPLWNVRGNQFAFHSNSVHPIACIALLLLLGDLTPRERPSLTRNRISISLGSCRVSAISFPYFISNCSVHT
jgi:hypothetical protein